MSGRGRLALPFAAFTLAFTACGGEQKPARDVRGTTPPSVAAMAPDTMMQRIDSTNAAKRADSVARAKPGARKTPPDTRLRDSAIQPKLELDSTGKARPITRPKRP